MSQAGYNAKKLSGEVKDVPEWDTFADVSSLSPLPCAKPYFWNAHGRRGLAVEKGERQSFLREPNRVRF